MFFVYGMQSQAEPRGPVKIGFSARPPARLGPLELGSLGARIHIIFQAEIGETRREGLEAERAYHERFAHLRINRETFRFDPEMLTWRPDGARRVDRDTYRSFAENIRMVDLRDLAGAIPDVVVRPNRQSAIMRAIDQLSVDPYRELQKVKRTRWD